MRNDVYIDKEHANTRELTKHKDISDDTFGKLRFYKSSPFCTGDNERVSCFTLQIRTIGKTTWQGKAVRRMISNVDVSIEDLRELLEYAENELIQHTN